MPESRPRFPRARAAVAAATTLILLILGVVWHVGREGESSADASDPALVALGVAVYGEHCASCHGADLEGEPDWRRRKADGTLPSPPHDASGHTWHHSDDMLFRLVRDGPAAIAGSGYRSTMPAYADILEDREIWAVLAYIKSRWPADIREAQAGR